MGTKCCIVTSELGCAMRDGYLVRIGSENVNHERYECLGRTNHFNFVTADGWGGWSVEV